jgi:hypothetical protein
VRRGVEALGALVVGRTLVVDHAPTSPDSGAR